MIDNLKDKVCHWLLTEAPTPLLITDAAGAIVLSNPAAQGLFGYSEEEFEGLPVEFLIPEPYRDRHQQDRADYGRDPSKRLMKAGRALHAKRRDGSEFVAEISLNPMDNGHVLATIQDVTERKQAEAMLVQHEREFRTLAENSPGNIMRYDHARRIRYMNQRMLETLGLPTADGLIGKTCSEIWSLEDTERYEETLKQVIARNTTLTFDTTHPDIGDGLRYHSINIVPEHNDAGEVIGALAIGWDISERKRAELEREAHAYFMECMDRVNRAIQGTNNLEQMMSNVLDIVLAIFDCDRAFLLYPCDPDVVEFRVPMERTRPEYPGALALGRAVPMGKEMEGLFRTVLGVAGPVKLGTGAEYPLPHYLSEQYGVKSQMVMALHPKQDKPWQFGLHQCSHTRVWSHDDERLFQEIGRRLEEGLTSLSMYRNLQASEHKFRSLAENMPDTLIRYDREGRRTYINPALKRISAVRNEQMIGLTQQESNPFTMPETYRLALEHTLATGERSEFELPISTPSGDVRTNLVFIAAERAADGKISGAITIGHDITERKQAQMALQAVNAEMEQVMRFHVVSQTVAAIAHELHQPLSALSSYAEAALRLLNAGNRQPDKLRHALERSVGQAQRAGQVVHELLTFMNQGEVQAEPVDMNNSARRVLERLKADYPDDFEGRLELESGLPRVSVNRLQVEKVLVNLIENGLDAMRDDGVGRRLITITVRSHSEGPVAQVTVRDSGSGIEAQTLHRVFDPFFTTKPNGLGMGLAISRAIIEANGGQLWVESEPGAGASFHFTLPFAS